MRLSSCNKCIYIHFIFCKKYNCCELILCKIYPLKKFQLIFSLTYNKFYKLMKKFIWILLLLFILAASKIYAVTDITCAEALNLSEELKNFYEAKDAFLKTTSEDNLIRLVNTHNYMMEESKTRPDTELHVAVSDKDIQGVRLLVAHGMPVDILGNQGRTPLSVAAASGDVNVINLLLSLKANVNAPNVVGSSPLHYAAQVGHVAAAIQLHERGADIHQTTLIGETPIMTAVNHGHQDMVRALASRGADVMGMDIRGYTLLHAAITSSEVKDRVGMIETILSLEGVSPEIIHQTDIVYGATPLHWAASRGQVDVINVLLQRGASLTSINGDGELPIHVAARIDQVEAFFVMLIKDLDLLNARDDKGLTPIDTARINKSKNTLLALRFTEDVMNFYEAKDAFLRTPSYDSSDKIGILYDTLGDKAEEAILNKPLHIAASENNITEIKKLVSSGMKVDVRGQTGATPLSIAAGFGHIDAINALLELGADVNAPDILGRSPLVYAVVASQNRAVQHLLARGAEVNQADIAGVTPVMFAVRYSHISIFRILTSQGADLTGVNVQGWTLLHSAVIFPIKDLADMIEAILDAVADDWPEIINLATPVAEASPLHWAVYYGRVDAVNVFIRRGASLTSINEDGELPIHVAARVDQMDIFLMLKNSNPNSLNAKDDKGRTPIDTAREHNSQKILSALGLSI